MSSQFLPVSLTSGGKEEINQWVFASCLVQLLSIVDLESKRKRMLHNKHQPWSTYKEFINYPLRKFSSTFSFWKEKSSSWRSITLSYLTRLLVFHDVKQSPQIFVIIKDMNNDALSKSASPFLYYPFSPGPPVSL